MMQRLIPLAVAALLLSHLAGCHGAGRHKSARGGSDTMAARVYLATLVWQDRTGKDYMIDLTDDGDEDGLELAPYVPLIGNNEFRLNVEGDDSKFEVLFAPDRQAQQLANGMIKSSKPSAYILGGVVIVSGTIPLAGSDWVHTSAEGTQWLIRVIPGDDRTAAQHWVYNLEPPDSSTPVHVKLVRNKAAGEHALMPGRKIMVTGDQTRFRPDEPFDASEPFVDRMLRRAAAAGMRLDPLTPKDVNEPHQAKLY